MLCKPSSLALSLALLALTGCSSDGPTTIPVDGVVRLDGAPVSGARVLFSPKATGRPAEGVTDAEGRFVLSTFAPRDGALPGEHGVTVMLVRTASTRSAGAPETSEQAFEASVASVGDAKPPEWIVPQRYSDLSSSGLSAQVGPASRTFTFELKTKP